MNKLQEVAKLNSALKYTENGAIAYNTTNNSLIDLFGVIGSLRSRDEDEIIEKFQSAFNQDKELAVKMMFYAGDIRHGGLGERRTFRIILRWLAQNYPSIVGDNICLIPLLNRWDSIFELIDTPCEQQMWQVIKDQIIHDLNQLADNQPISLLGKWLPSINTSSEKTRKLAKRIAKALGYQDERGYRHLLSILREEIRVTERQMSLNQWERINFEAVPSYAMKNYTNAFEEHQPERFTKYLADVRLHKQTIKAGTLYPYDLVRPIIMRKESSTNELQWNALPNYIDKESNILVMADISGSMCTANYRPISTSIGLAIYFAEHNKGPLHNVYMTFTANPHFQYINENDSLKTKVQKVFQTDYGLITNLEKAFEYLLQVAQANEFTQKDMPAAIVVISDMEIDSPQYQNTDFFKLMKTKYAQAGYKLPKLILWNVEARNDTFLSQDNNIIKVSGSSASTFKHLIGNLNGKTDWDIMIETLDNPWYNKVKVN